MSDLPLSVLSYFSPCVDIAYIIYSFFHFILPVTSAAALKMGGVFPSDAFLVQLPRLRVVAQSAC